MSARSTGRTSSTRGRPRVASNPLPIAGAAGSYVWDYEGRRYLDFSSQLVNTNIGHQHPKVVAAIRDQAARLCTVGPQYACEVAAKRRGPSRKSPPVISTGCSSRTGAPRRSRTRRACAPAHGTHQGPRGLPLVSRLDDDRHQPHGRPASLGERLRQAGVGTSSGPSSTARRSTPRARTRSAPGHSSTSRRWSSSRGHRTSRRSCSRRFPVLPGSWCRLPATWLACGKSATDMGSSSLPTR